jgi:uncharacterized protein (TIGR03435 family)
MLAGMNLILFAACTANGQTVTALAGFEVASIRPSDPGAAEMQIDVSPGGVFTAKGVTLRALIQNAYEVRDFQISGGPPWLDSERYNIVAKGNGGGVSMDELRKMTNEQREAFQTEFRLKVRTLLADRFQLRIHRETREGSVYALSVARNGPRIRVAADDDVAHSGLTIRRGEGGKEEIIGTGIPLANLVKSLSQQLGRTVVDQTGLTGNYDFKIAFTPDMGRQATAADAADRSSSASADGPSIFTALQEQLGLRLQAQKGPVEALVIDSAQKASEN